MEPGSIILIVIAIAIVILFITQYNTIKTLQNKVRQSKSGIDVALTKRFDLIPNLVECVKGYCKHEEKVLNDVTKARADYYKSKSLAVGEITNNKTKDILLLAEKYPSLKSSSQFIELQAALERTESSLAAARRLYNSDVTMYNTKIGTFPGNIFATFMGAKLEKTFEADESVKSNVQVKL